MVSMGSMGDIGDLGDRDRQLLDFERDWRAHAGRKEQAINAALAISSARYYQLLARLLDDPVALAYDPLTIRRLRRRRQIRQQRRASLVEQQQR